MYVVGVCLHVCLCTTCGQCSWRPEDGIGFLGTGITGGYRDQAGAGDKPQSSGRAPSHLSSSLLSTSCFSQPPFLCPLLNYPAAASNVWQPATVLVLQLGLWAGPPLPVCSLCGCCHAAVSVASLPVLPAQLH